MWSVEESRSRFELQAAAFSLPTLVIQSTHDVSVFPSMAQNIYDMVGSKEKELRRVPGAHYFEDECSQCYCRMDDKDPCKVRNT